jgi:hypothetical protein
MSEAENIERFAALLEETGTGRHHRPPAGVEPELQALVAVTHRLARTPLPAVRPEARDATLAQLLAHWDQEGPAAVNAAPPPQPRDRQPAEVAWPRNPVVVAPRPRRSADDPEPAQAATTDVETQAIRTVGPRRVHRARLAVVIGLTTGTLALSGVALASGGAKPGDTLYRVKGWGEQAQLMFAGADADRGRLHLDFARMRLVEARAVGAGAVVEVLAEMDREITEGARLIFTDAFASGDRAALESVITFVKQHRAEVSQARMPDAATRSSLDLLAAVETRAHELQAALADGCTTSTMDHLGPRPTC